MVAHSTLMLAGAVRQGSKALQTCAEAVLTHKQQPLHQTMQLQLLQAPQMDVWTWQASKQLEAGAIQAVECGVRYNTQDCTRFLVAVYDLS